MHFNIELFVLWKCEDLNFKLQSPESPSPCGHFQTQGLEVSINYMPPWIQNPKTGLNFEHFDRIIKQDIILEKLVFTKLNTRRLWRITNFFQFFIMNDKLYTTV